MYLLDTNVCVEIMRGRPARVRDRFQSLAKRRAEMFVSSVTSFELWYGVDKSEKPDVNRRLVELLLTGPLEVLNFDEEDSRSAGAIRAALESEGKTIGPFDTLIAGQALRRDLTVVTANVREFSRVQGLRLENWAVAPH